jgi:hypothetical protein
LYNQCVAGEGDGAVQNFAGEGWQTLLLLLTDVKLTTTYKPVCCCILDESCAHASWNDPAAALIAGFAQRLRGVKDARA